MAKSEATAEMYCENCGGTMTPPSSRKAWGLVYINVDGPEGLLPANFLFCCPLCIIEWLAAKTRLAAEPGKT